MGGQGGQRISHQQIRNVKKGINYQRKLRGLFISAGSLNVPPTRFYKIYFRTRLLYRKGDIWYSQEATVTIPAHSRGIFRTKCPAISTSQRVHQHTPYSPDGSQPADKSPASNSNIKCFRKLQLCFSRLIFLMQLPKT